MPEAEVLKALNYYKLCHYDEALKLIENYYSFYGPRSKSLEKIIKKERLDKKNYFFKIMFNSISQLEEKNMFLRNLTTQVSKRVKFNLDLKTLYALDTELMRGHKKSNVKKVFKMKNDLEEQINHYVKVSMYRFINKIHSLSGQMFNLKLEILSSKRTILYKTKKFEHASNKDKRAPITNIKKEKHQNFWTFQNAFWADELGDYSFSLDSRCKVVSSKLRRR